MSQKICAECGMANPVSEDICGECGLSLEDATATVEQVSTLDLSCPSCGNAVGSDMRFCDSCGTNLKENAKAEPAAPPPAAPEPPPQTPPQTAVAPPPQPEPAAPVPAPAAVAPPTSDQQVVIGKANQTWKLSTVEGFHIGKQYLLYRSPMLIGRQDEEGEIYPELELSDQDDGFVSRRHAEIRLNQGAVCVVDLGGENGTFVNGRRIPPHKEVPLGPQDVVRVGKVGLMLVEHRERGN